jgi:4Fe-4S ferredoxin
MTAVSTNTTRRSAQDCPQPAGRYIPVVNRNRCEGKEDCLAACPCNVFEMQALSEADKNAMPFLSRFKARLHGNRQAFAVRPNDCQACGQCIAACPEQAITLRQIGAQ